MTTKFWLDDISVLFTDMDDFYPSYDMNLVEKLNAIVRLSLYLGIILTLVSYNYLYLYIPIAISGFTILIYKTQKQNMEQFFIEYDRQCCSDNKPCVKPTVHNPFMNFNYITDDRNRPPACKSYDNEAIKQDIEDKFNQNLYRDVGDLYSKNNSQREFYTMPSSRVVSDQTSFAKFLYAQPQKTCKEDSISCAPEWSPIETNQIFEPYVNN